MTADELLTGLASLGLEPRLTPESYQQICKCGFRGIDNNIAVAVLAELAIENQPLTVRSLMYRAVSCGLFPSTDAKWYDKTVRLVGRMRRAGIIPYEFIVDNMRATQKPSTWSGLSEFADTVRESYRKDFWSQLPAYVHVICEKDAIAGTISGVTEEYDVALSPIRGYISDSYAYELGTHFRNIEKPAVVCYLGDFDPSGMDIERDCRDKLETFKRGPIPWKRLGVLDSDFDEFRLIELRPKRTDSRWRTFVQGHGCRAAEIDAIPPNELRRRVRNAIEAFVPEEKWERLKAVEELERESFSRTLNALK